MNVLGGSTINPEAEADDDDEDEDLDDASTIVPPSPLGSRRNSLAHSVPNNIGSKRGKAAGLGQEAGVVLDDAIIMTNRHRRRGGRVDDEDEAEEEGGESAVEAEKASDNTEAQLSSSKLSPRVAVILGVDRKWYLPLVIGRALSVVPALWWGLRCAFTFLAELLRIRPGMWREGWVAIIVSSAAADWDVERRFRVTEVALAIMWVCIQVLRQGICIC